MNSYSRQVKTVVLELTEKEAIWLQNLMQNAHDKVESKEDSDMREAFWMILNMQGSRNDSL